MKEYKSKMDKIRLVRDKQDFNKVQIKSSYDSNIYCRNFYDDDITIYESFFMMLLNNSNNTIGYVKISQGGITGTVVDVRIITKYAIESLATGVIICHNHPSGALKPSRADEDTTKKIKDALNFFDIKLLDHLIITEDGYLSFADENRL